MQFEIKKIVEIDINLVTDFIAKQKTFVRTTGVAENPSKYLSSNTKTIYGAFKNNELVSMLGASFSLTDNSYIIVAMKTVPNKFKYFNMKENGLGLLWEKIISEFEANGYYTFYLLHNRTKWPIQKMGKMWIDNIPSLKKYYGTIHSIIPANTRPKFDMHWRLMGETTWPTDMILEKRALKSLYYPADYKIYNVITEEEIEYDKL